jgi:ankyrin repeat protein
MYAAESGNVDAVQFLIQQGACVSACDAVGETALMKAEMMAEHEDRTAVIALLKQAGAR